MTDSLETFARSAGTLLEYYCRPTDAPTAIGAELDPFAALLERRIAAITPPESALCRLFVEAVREYLQTGTILTQKLQSRASQSQIGPDEFKRVVQALNEVILFPRERELNGHNVQRTFRFWDAEEKAVYLTFCGELVELLSARFAHVCVGFGAILALIRDHELMPHDDDIDIVVAFDRRHVPDYPAALALVTEALLPAGYTVKGDHPAHRWVMAHDHRTVDVFVALIEDDRISSFPAPRRAIPLDTMFPAIRAPLFGVETRIPRNPWKYLESVYGADWMTPQSVWGHRAKWADYVEIIKPDAPAGTET